MEDRHLILESLISRGRISQVVAQEALTRSADAKISVLQLLLDEKVIDESDIFKVVADNLNMEFVDPAELNYDLTAINKISADMARKFRVLPYAWRGDNLLVIVDDPGNPDLIDDIRRLVKVEPQFLLTNPKALDLQLAEIYRAGDELDNIANALELDTVVKVETESLTGLEGTEIAPTIKWVDTLILQAISDRASDIHIEPSEFKVNVRVRIDGVLHNQTSANKSIHSPIISRIKIMAGMDISERRNPQDGRITVKIQEKKVDLRVVTVPTVWGEKVIMRILDNSSVPLLVKNMGFNQYHMDIFAQHYTKPHGMILITGPTGSGKSTTLYATLNTIKDPSVNIMTIEDPVESIMPGVSQIAINNAAGLTFSTVLRAILRADPDILLVGEIRDRETANLAVEAAQTGHLVLSTLHTNDASSAVTRLVEMGVEPFLVGSALSLVVAQRLLRKICERCAKDFTPYDEELISAGFNWSPGEPKPTLRKAVGCKHCTNTGYRGRFAIHEMFEVTPAIERLINKGAHTDELRDEAINVNGMHLMKEDGWEKVRAGLTTIEEVLRVTK